MPSRPQSGQPTLGCTLALALTAWSRCAASSFTRPIVRLISVLYPPYRVAHSLPSRTAFVPLSTSSRAQAPTGLLLRGFSRRSYPQHTAAALNRLALPAVGRVAPPFARILGAAPSYSSSHAYLHISPPPPPSLLLSRLPFPCPLPVPPPPPLPPPSISLPSSVPLLLSSYVPPSLCNCSILAVLPPLLQHVISSKQ
jgi:hypothetical protein